MEEDGSQGQGTAEGQGQDTGDEFVNGILEKVPEADRNVVAKYFNEWNSGVQNRFQSIHDEYRGYKDLGSVDDIKAYKNAVELLETNPVEFYSRLEAELKKQNLLQPPAQSQQQTPPTPPVGDGSKPQEFQGLPPEIQERLKKQEELVEQLARTVLAKDAEQRKAQQDAELDAQLKQLKTSKGDFDEDYVLAKMLQGKSPEQAVDEYFQRFGGNGQSRTPAPPPLSGGGFVSQQQNVKDMSRNEVQDLVAGILKSTHQE